MVKCIFAVAKRVGKFCCFSLFPCSKLFFSLFSCFLFGFLFFFFPFPLLGIFMFSPSRDFYCFASFPFRYFARVLPFEFFVSVYVWVWVSVFYLFSCVYFPLIYAIFSVTCVFCCCYVFRVV